MEIYILFFISGVCAGFCLLILIALIGYFEIFTAFIIDLTNSFYTVGKKEDKPDYDIVE